MLCFFMKMQATFSKNHVGKVLDLGWFVLPHLSYSADFALTDFYLFHSLQNAQNDKKKKKKLRKFIWKHSLRPSWVWNKLNFTWTELIRTKDDSK